MVAASTQGMPLQASFAIAEEPLAAGDATVLTPEAARLQELFKYFLATSQSVGYIDSDIESQAGYNPKNAHLSSDPVLNGLTQLAVYRLAAERAFISLIDDEHQYVIAEATREISLFDANSHPPNQGLCIGARPLDLFAGVCAATMPAFTNGDASVPFKSTSNIYADSTRYIINDFALEDEYKNRPYVSGFPFMRYYAEVPLKSLSGYVIGTLAVLDNKPRIGLSEHNFLALTEISATIMRHLEKLKVDQDHKQASRLLRGLNTFVESDPMAYEQHTGKQGTYLDAKLPSEAPSSIENIREHNKNKRQKTTADLPDLVSDVTPSSHVDSSFLHHRTTTKPLLNLAPSRYSSNSQFVESGTNSGVNARETGRGTDSIVGETEGKGSPPMRDIAMSYNTADNFSRAASILRPAMELDGFVFLDAVSYSFASRTDLAASYDRFISLALRESQGASQQSSADEGKMLLGDSGVGTAVSETLDMQASFTESREAANVRLNASIPVRMSGLLGYSTTKSRSAVGDVSGLNEFSIPDNVHQNLLRRYPKGNIFDFNQTNNHLPDGTSWLHSVSDDYVPGAKFRDRDLEKSDIDIALRFAFPNVRSLIFLPLWHPQRESWFAGCFAWTTSPKRVFQKDDLAYLAVFGNSVVAEVTRLDLVASDRAKSNFISSVSHELRSPLHGILGNAELLQQHAMDANQQQMVTMVEHCGRTMLDIVEHVLDFAKINIVESNSKINVGGARDSTHDASKAPLSASQSIFELHQVVEETIESLVAGHKYNIASMKRFSDDSQPRSYAAIIQSDEKSPFDNTQTRDIVIIVNVEHNRSWHVISDIAAWRRIILNLLGNALKYTETGLIEVILRMTAPSSEYDLEYLHSTVNFTVRDTGRGMSEHYLQTSLYTPFVQENDLSSGTGLGLSIVQKVVHDLRGTINVQSKVGCGTQVDVSMPLSLSQAIQGTTQAVKQHNGTFCFVGFDLQFNPNKRPADIIPVESRIITAARAALESYAEQWCGLKAVATPDSSQITADLVLINEKCIHLLQTIKEDGTKSIAIPPGSSVIIISMNDNSDGYYKPDKNGRLQRLEQPIGPLKLARAIDIALSADREKAAEMNNLGAAAGPEKEASTYVTQSRVKDTAELAEPEAHPSRSDEQEKETRPNLLLVDDNNINLTMLAAHASRLKCDYVTAANGKEAVSVYCSTDKPFDYVLMDVSMPIMDGFQATRAIRDFERANTRSPTPIVALTGLGSAEAQREAFECGMDMFLTKPVPMKKIKTLVEEGINSLR